MIPRLATTFLMKYLDPNKVVLLYGPRQVGKTTLVREYLKNTPHKYAFYSGDNIRIHEILGSQRFDRILPFVKDIELLVLDEAQKIPNIGMGLKIIVDQVPGIRIIATGSASFELAGQVGEPLTGRKWTLILYPISQLELLDKVREFDLKERLNEFLLHGGYPSVVSEPIYEKKQKILTEIVDSYLLKDILELEKVKGSKALLDLLRLLALQVGNQVSLTELGSQLGLNYKTVARYLDLLEKAFVIVELHGYARNLRKEIRKKSKYYFWDTGIRNAIINNFNGLNLRNDVGALWENFCVIERLKYQAYSHVHANNYFWRTWEQTEVDWVEEREGKLYGFEFVYSENRKKSPKVWLDTYKEASFAVVNRENYLSFVAGKEQ